MSTQIDVAPDFAQTEAHIFSDRLKTAALLGVAAAWSHHVSRSGMSIGWNEDLKAFIESCGHPVLGYVGAWIGIEIAPKLRAGKIAGEVALASATAANFVTEVCQEVVSPVGENPFAWTHDPSETTKDYLFSLLGMGWLLKQSRQVQ